MSEWDVISRMHFNWHESDDPDRVCGRKLINQKAVKEAVNLLVALAKDSEAAISRAPELPISRNYRLRARFAAAVHEESRSLLAEWDAV